MKPSEISQLQENENLLVKQLLKEYIGITESPVYPSWIAMQKQIKSFTDELTDNPIGIRSKAPKKKGKKKNDDIAEELPQQESVDDEKDFAKAEKVMSKLPEWVNSAMQLYAMMTPDEKEKADNFKNKRSAQVAT